MNMIFDGTESVEGGTGWYLVVLGQYNLVLLGVKWNWVSFMPLYIENLVRCHHSGTDGRRTNKER